MPEENTLKVVEATATNAIELPDGRRIDALVQVPTTENDYGGDDAAAMLADVVARRSTKSGDTLTVDEMDRVILEKEYGLITQIAPIDVSDYRVLEVH